MRLLQQVPERNLEAYKILFQIKNILRDLHQDYNFKRGLKIHQPTLSDHIYVGHKITKLIPDDIAKKLYRLIPIRNKVCHMRPIDEWEYNFLLNCLEELLLEKLITKYNNCSDVTFLIK